MSGPTQLQPLSKSRHGGLYWMRPQGHWYAARHMLVPVAMAELARLVSLFPLAFVPRGGGPVLHALLGLEEGRCACVDHRGQWRAPYVPAWLRSHPFYLATGSGGQYVVAVDANAPELQADAATGSPICDAAGALTADVEAAIEPLRARAQHHAATDRATQALAEAGLLVPWQPSVRVGGSTRTLGGLQRVDETRLQALPADALAALRDAGALGLAYAQLLSTEQIRVLEHQAQRRRREEAHLPAMDDMIGDAGGEQQFDWGALGAEDDPPGD